ncbi:MAG: hypothetical protein ACT4PT_11695 [Methanobacteriota archaeon]
MRGTLGALLLASLLLAYCLVASTATASWTTPRTLATLSDAGAPSAARDSADGFVVAAPGGGRVTLFRLDAEGAPRGETTVLVSEGVSEASVAPLGDGHLVLLADATQGPRAFGVGRNGSVAEASVMPTGLARPRVASHPVLAAGPEATAVGAFVGRETTESPGRLSVRAWSEEPHVRTIAGEARVASAGRVAVAESGGYFAVVWDEADGASPPLLYVRVHAVEGAVHQSTELLVAEPALAPVAVGASGIVHVAYLDLRLALWSVSFNPATGNASEARLLDVGPVRPGDVAAASSDAGAEIAWIRASRSVRSGQWTLGGADARVVANASEGDVFAAPAIAAADGRVLLSWLSGPAVLGASPALSVTVFVPEGATRATLVVGAAALAVVGLLVFFGLRRQRVA